MTFVATAWFAGDFSHDAVANMPSSSMPVPASCILMTLICDSFTPLSSTCASSL